MSDGWSSALLAPRRIAIVGASDDPAKTASRPLRFLREGGFDGELYPVARRATVLGHPAWRSLDDLPHRPDHAFILLPTDGAIDAVAACVRLGVPAVTVLAGGFAEAGPEGAERQSKLLATVQGSGTRLLGPNSLGLVNLHRNTVLTANAAFAEQGLPRGGLFVASQSGSMIGALASRGKTREIGFATLVSVGAEADLCLGEICEAALDDPGVHAFVLFLESIRGGAALRRFAAGAAARGKPVLAYKLGRSKAGAELAQSHTGAIASADDIADAFLQDCGIARVETLEALLEAPALLRRIPAARARGGRSVVGVVTTTGGGAAMVVDQLGIRGVEVVGPSGATSSRLAKAGIEHPLGSRIVDLTLAGTQYAMMKAALDAMLADPGYDLIVAVVGSSARFQPELAVRPVIDCAGVDARLAAFLVPEAPDALASLARAQVPAFRLPESCADAIRAAMFQRMPSMAAVVYDQPRLAGRQLVDELAAYRILAEVGIEHATCAEYGAVAPDGIAFPMAVKLLSDQVAHKTDVGGVVLNVRDEQELVRTASAIRATVGAVRPDLGTVRLLAQKMISGLGEALLGYWVDAEIGPLVMVAAGGTMAELFKDRSVRPAPVTAAVAQEMVGEVRALAALSGLRGKPRGDLDALAAAVAALSNLARRPDLRIVECEVNPLIVRADGAGVIAVDACAWTEAAP